MHETHHFLKTAPEKILRAAHKAIKEYPESADIKKSWEDLINPKLCNFDRTAALFSLLRSAIPDAVFNHFTNHTFALQKDSLPIDPKQYILEEKRVGKGYECRVYKLASLDINKPSLVIKIDQLGSSDTEQLLKRANELRSTYEEQKSWYATLPGFIPDESRFITKHPYGGSKALFTIQEFFGDAAKIKDLFREVPQDELLALLQEDSRLATAFRTFVSITLEQANRHDRMVDTLGDKNIALIDTKDGKRLILLDPHVTYHPSQAKPETQRKLLADLAYLKDILSLLDTIETIMPPQQT